MIRRCADYLRVKGICFLIILSLVVAFLFLGRHIDIKFVCGYFETLSVAHPYWSVGLFFLLQLAVVLLGVLPASVSVVGAGIVFGVVEGFCIAAPAVLLGSMIAFGLSRSLLRETVARLCGRHGLFRVLEDIITKKGWKAVCLLRLSPILPFALTNYAIGFTKVSFRAYFVGTLFSLPPLFGYVFIGALTRNGLVMSETGRVEWIKLALDAVYTVSTIATVWYTGRVCSRYLKDHST